MSTKLDTSNNRTAPIEMAPDEFRALGHQLVDSLADWLARAGCIRDRGSRYPHQALAVTGGEIKARAARTRFLRPPLLARPRLALPPCNSIST
jgi:hypothetical protein